MAKPMPCGPTQCRPYAVPAYFQPCSVMSVPPPAAAPCYQAPAACPMPVPVTQLVPPPAAPCCQTRTTCQTEAIASDGRTILMSAAVLSVDRSYWSRPDAAAWADLSPKACEHHVKVLSEAEARRFLQALQAQNGGEFLSRPQIMTQDGQRAAVSIGGDMAFVTGVSMVQRDGQFVPEFQRDSRQTEVGFSFVPTVSADSKFVRLQVEASLCRAMDAGKEYRVTVEAPARSHGPKPSASRALNVYKFQTTVNAPVEQCVLLHTGPSGVEAMRHGPAVDAPTGSLGDRNRGRTVRLNRPSYANGNASSAAASGADRRHGPER